MLRYFIWTIGCQMNKAESLWIAGYLDSAGWQVADVVQEADLVVLNTCVVRQSAENKVLGMLGLLKGLKKEHPDILILVTGCFVDSDIVGLKRRFPHVDFFFKPGAFSQLTGWIQQKLDVCSTLDAQYLTLEWRTPSPCAFIPIIQGCNKFCSYCIVPYRRGREISRTVEEVVCEVKGIVGQGVKEVTLLGQTVDSYGGDLPERRDLADLLTELNGIGELDRIRFLTNHPRDMNQKLIEAIASLDKVCEHLDLAVQSGDNDILKAMRRGYTVEQFRKLIYTIRQCVPGISLSTDIIVGFPGETEEQFEHTFSLLEEMRFNIVHVAAYSPRPGTVAYQKYKDNVPLEVKKERFDRIEQLQTNVATIINSAYRGETMEVLVEGQKKGKWYGRTRGDKIVFFKSDDNCLGQLIIIRVEKTSPWSLQGSVEYKS